MFYQTGYDTFHTLANATSALDTAIAAASGFSIGAAIPSGAVDLRAVYGAGAYMKNNKIGIIINSTGAANGDTLTELVYGIADGGPPQLLASIAWTIGTARADGATATHLWADTATVTDAGAAADVIMDGGGSDRVCQVELDVSGYRYIYGLITAQVGDITLVTAYIRCYARGS